MTITLKFLMNLTEIFVTAIISGLIGSVFGGLITLWLTNWKEKKEGNLRFKNRLLSIFRL